MAGFMLGVCGGNDMGDDGPDIEGVSNIPVPGDGLHSSLLELYGRRAVKNRYFLDEGPG